MISQYNVFFLTCYICFRAIRVGLVLKRVLICDGGALFVHVCRIYLCENFCDGYVMVPCICDLMRAFVTLAYEIFDHTILFMHTPKKHFITKVPFTRTVLDICV